MWRNKPIPPSKKMPQKIPNLPSLPKIRQNKIIQFKRKIERIKHPLPRSKKKEEAARNWTMWRATPVCKHQLLPHCQGGYSIVIGNHRKRILSLPNVRLGALEKDEKTLGWRHRRLLGQTDKDGESETS